MGAWSSKEKDRDLAVTMRRPSVVMILSRSGPALSYSNTAITLGREKTRGELSFDQQSDGPAYGSPFVKAALSTLAGRIPVYAVVAALVLGFTCIGIGGAIRQHHLDEVSRAVLERPQYTSLVTTASLSSLPALTSPSSVSVSSSLAASATATPGPSLFARRRDGIGAIYKSGVRAGATSTRTSTSVQPSGTVYVDAAHRASHNGAVLVGMTERQKELASLALNIGVTILTEANGYVHGATLRTNLAKIDRLAFNANLRLFRSGGSFWSANGLVSNILFSVSLVLAYASTNLVFCYLGRNLFITSGLPLLVLGGCIIVQAVIALWGYFVTSDIIWSTSALETTAACQVLGHVAARPGRCLAPVAHWDHHDPFWLDGAKPAEPQQRQPSAWQSHATVRRVVLFMWFTVGMGFAWAFTSLGYLIVREKRIAEQWSPLVDDESPYIGIYLPVGDNFSGALILTFTEGVRMSLMQDFDDARAGPRVRHPDHLLRAVHAHARAAHGRAGRDAVAGRVALADGEPTGRRSGRDGPDPSSAHVLAVASAARFQELVALSLQQRHLARQDRGHLYGRQPGHAARPGLLPRPILRPRRRLRHLPRPETALRTSTGRVWPHTDIGRPHRRVAPVGEKAPLGVQAGVRGHTGLPARWSVPCLHFLLMKCSESY